MEPYLTRFVVCGILCLVLGKSVADSELKLPSNLNICDLSLPNDERNECVRKSIEKFMTTPHQNTDDFEFPSFDPFTLASATFKYKNTGLYGGTFTVKNIKTYGFSQAKVLRVKTNFTDSSFQLLAEFNFPKVHQTGSYRSNFTLNVFHIQSQGQYNATLKDVNTKWYIKGKVEEVGGKRYMKIYRFDAIPDAKDVKFSVSGLFPDPELNRVVNDFMNDNWKLLYKEMIGETRRQWEPILLELSNKFFSQIPWPVLSNL